MPRRGGGPRYARPKRPRMEAWKILLTLWAVVTLAVAAVWRTETASRDDNRDGVPDWLPGAGVETPAFVREDLIPVNDYSRPGRWLEQVNGVVIHYVGNPGSSAQGNRDYFANLASGRENTYASSHYVVGLKGEVLQCVPLTEVSYASNHRNGDTIGIEVCHPDADGKFSDTTYASLMELTAWLCDTFDLDPETDVIRHYDVTGKECPRYYVKHPEAWDQLRRDVAAKLAQMRAA